MLINKYRLAIAWLVGYFVTLFPVYYAMSGSWVMGFLVAIYGVIGAILILKGWRIFT
jgi:membrane-anchored protein YejM (alkaline phosphatase superfamily)